MVLLAGLPVRAEDANPVLAKVNGVEIRQSDLTLAEEELGPSLAQMDPATKKDNVLSFLIDMKIVAKAAEDKKVENNEDFKKRLAFTRNRLLMDSLLATEGKAATTDEAMKKVYEDASKQITGEQEVHARHILVESEDEAKAVAEELKKGADFAELAKKKSKDPGASDGGDLGFFTKDQMVPEFSTVAFALEPGKISDPGEVAVRLAHHQGRGKAQPQGARFRAGQGPDRDLCDAQGAGRLRGQAARSRQGRALDKPAEAAAKTDAKPDAAKPADAKMAPGEEVRQLHRRPRRTSGRRPWKLERARPLPSPTIAGDTERFPRLEAGSPQCQHAVSPLAPTEVPDMPVIAGVKLATAAAGIRYKGRTDVLLAVMDKGTTVAGVFTKSKCPSAPVEWCRAKLKPRIFQGRACQGAGGEFRQRQRLHRQDRTAVDDADGVDRRQGRSHAAPTRCFSPPPA